MRQAAKMHSRSPSTYSTIISQAGCVSRLMLSKIFCHMGASQSYTFFCFERGQCFAPRMMPPMISADARCLCLSLSVIISVTSSCTIARGSSWKIWKMDLTIVTLSRL